LLLVFMRLLDGCAGDDCQMFVVAGIPGHHENRCRKMPNVVLSLPVLLPRDCGHIQFIGDFVLLSFENKRRPISSLGLGRSSVGSSRISAIASLKKLVYALSLNLSRDWHENC
jgi:hypothetical protein